METMANWDSHDMKAKMYAISSDTHQLQFIKLHHFKQDFNRSSDFLVINETS